VIVATVGALVGTTAGLALPAEAHEDLELGGLNASVGWAEEPAFTGSMNQVQVTLTDDAGEPFTELGDSLRVEVIFGDADADQRIELPLEAQFTEDSGQPGEYGAAIVPTRPGTYTFRFVGSVNGQDVDESITSGPDTFEEPREPTDIQFPVSDLSVAQLNERLDRELERLGAAPSDAEAGAGTGSTTAGGTSGDGGDGAGTVLGIVGIIVGAVGVAGAGLALRRSRALA
jgi:hypothetical protein